MAFISNRITSNQFVGPLDGTAQTASLALQALTASFVSGSIESASFAATASYAFTASLALDSEKIGGKALSELITTGSTDSTQILSGSLIITQNLDVLGSSSFVFVTASQVLLEQNTITTFAQTPGITTGGYIVADSSSLSNSGSILYNASTEQWTATKPFTFSGSVTTLQTSSADYFVVGKPNNKQPFAKYNGSGSLLLGIVDGEERGLVLAGTNFVESANSSSIVFGEGQIQYIESLHKFTGSVNISGSLLVNGVAPGTGGGASVTISGSAPSGSNPSGSLWWNSNDGNLYIQVTSPTGSTFVPATNTVAGGEYGATFRNEYTGSTWTVNHNLNTTSPIVNVYSGSAVMIPSTIVSVNANTTQITFSGSVRGTAVASTGVGGPTSSSFALNAVSSISSSFATSASFATTASFIQTASFAVSASALSGSQATYLTVNKSSTAQSLTSTPARLTNWDGAITSINAGEWNGTTGLFTATKAGVYLVTAQLQVTSAAYSPGATFAVYIYKNSGSTTVGLSTFQTTQTLLPGACVATAIISLAVGDTISIFGLSSTTANTHNTGNSLTIQELPARIQR